MNGTWLNTNASWEISIFFSSLFYDIAAFILQQRHWLVRGYLADCLPSEQIDVVKDACETRKASTAATV